jgi:ethanolamine ammonia-lyase large subunit
MSRIAPLQPPYAPEIQSQFDAIMRGAPPLLLFRVLAGHGRAWNKFRAGSLLDRGPLSLREREIVIDRTCALAGCEYEWGVHVQLFAAAAGLSEQQVAATRGRDASA